MRPTTLIALAAVAIAGAAYYATMSLLLHHSFHSYGWDLGIFEQVLWNTSEGRWFEYSFRQMRYLGDHWQPSLLLLVPLDWLFDGSDALLIAQAVGIGAAVFPLFAATRKLLDTPWAWAAVGAYILSLGVVRAANYDFHPESFMPLLLFTALWMLASERRIGFLVTCLGLLLMKEDGVLSVLAFAWIAWVGFGRTKEARIAAAGGVLYAATVSIAVMPFFLGPAGNPLNERYGYLLPGNAIRSPISAATEVVEHLLEPTALGAMLLVLVSAALIPLLRPKLLPALAVVVIPPLLSNQGAQSSLHLHYLVVPMSMALAVGLVAARQLRGSNELRLKGVLTGAPAALPLIAVLLFAWKSPLPPSFASDTSRFDVDAHSAAAKRVIAQVPVDAKVSAQATLVPHLAERKRILEFPRVGNAEWVVIDSYRDVPSYDLPGFAECRDLLPAMGFVLVSEEDGVSLWHKQHRAFALQPLCHFVPDRVSGF